jgi:hypothetical protein
MKCKYLKYRPLTVCVTKEYLTVNQEYTGFQLKLYGKWTIYNVNNKFCSELNHDAGNCSKIYRY